MKSVNSRCQSPLESYPGHHPSCTESAQAFSLHSGVADDLISNAVCTLQSFAFRIEVADMVCGFLQYLCPTGLFTLNCRNTIPQMSERVLYMIPSFAFQGVVVLPL